MDEQEVREIEANRFAVELLMPYNMVLSDIGNDFDIENDEKIKPLAIKYGVSEQLMIMRIDQIITNQRRRKP